MKYNSKLFILLVSGMIFLVAIGYYYTASEKDTTQDIKTYSDGVISFEYPSVLSVQKKGNVVTLDHSLAYTHHSACDFKGDAPALDRFTDFSLSFEVVDVSVKKYIELAGWPDWEYVAANPFRSDSFSGFKISPGVEGCGEDIYYLELSSGKTLIIKHPFVAELTTGDAQRYLGLPGVLLPNKSKEFVSHIITSLRIK